MIRRRSARPFPGLHLLFLATVACAGPPPKDEGGTNDTAPPDTGVDSAPDSETASDTDTGPVDRCASSGSWTHVTAGAHSTCGVHVDGCVECWGVFPTDDSKDSDWVEWSPWPAEDIPFEAVDLSWNTEDYHFNSQHACGIRSDTGEIFCWGSNPYHSLDAPTGVWSQVVVASTYACATDQDEGVLTCWGGSSSPRQVSADGAYPLVDLYFSDLVALGLDGVLHSLDVGSLEEGGSARGPYTTFSVSADGYVYAVRHDGGVDVWVPQLDRGNPDNHPRVADPLVPDPIYACATREQFCVLGASGEVLCLRDGGTSPPTADFVQLTCGEYHACGLTSDGSIECWGSCGGSWDPCDVPP